MKKITKEMISELRKISFQGIMDCKLALQDADGDINRAVEILQEKGLMSFIQRNDKETSEGNVFVAVNEHSSSTIMGSLCCETDFVTKNEIFQKAVADIITCLTKTDPKNLTNILEISSLLKASHDGVSIADIVAAVFSKIKEKIIIGDFAIYPAISDMVTAHYVHFNKKVGAMVQLKVKENIDISDKRVISIANDIALHITAMNPMGYDEDDLSLDLIETERKIFAEQIKDKPEQIKENIINGKMHKFYSRHCLKYQSFVKDPSITIQDLINSEPGIKNIHQFDRLSIG